VSAGPWSAGAREQCSAGRARGRRGRVGRDLRQYEVLFPRERAIGTPHLHVCGGRVCESTTPRVFYILSWAALHWLPDQREQLAASNRDAQSSLAIGHTSTSETIGGPFPPSSMTE